MLVLSGASGSSLSLDQALESSIVKYPYDATRAAQLLTQAGWARGPIS